MPAAAPERDRTLLDAAVDVFRMRQYFNVIVRVRDVAAALRHDAAFLDAVRRGLVPLPHDRRAVPHPVFRPTRRVAPAELRGRVGVVATGGSGALASLVGVARALEESGTPVAVFSVCSGSALFGLPLGVGMSAEEVAEMTAALDPGDYVDVGWREFAALVPRRGRGWAGLIRGDRLEAFYRRHLGDLTLRQLKTPTYAPIWSVEHNRLEFLGPRTYPDLPVARAVRMAVSLPLFVQPVELGGEHWCDGGLVDIFPVRPVLDIEPAVDTAIALNCFYPHEFRGEDMSGWDRRSLSILYAAAQVRTSQQAQLAREHLARLRAAVPTILLEPVPYWKVAGAGFYRHFLDNREWPAFMRAGRTATLAALRREAAAHAA